MESYSLMSLQSGYLMQVLFNINVRFLSIISRHQTEQKWIFLSYVDDCVYWHTSEALEKWIVDDLGNIFHVNFLGYAHWFISFRIYQMKDHSISVDQARYANSFVAKCLDTFTVKTGTNFYKTNLPSDMIFTKADASTIYEQVKKLTREFNIHYRSFIGLLIYLLSTRVDFIFSIKS